MNYSIKPEEHELREARQTVEKTLEGCKYVVEKEVDFSVQLGHADKGEVGEFGVFGSANSAEVARIYFNAQKDSWKDNLEDLVADVYGQSWFLENSKVNFQWQEVLASITGLMIIEEISGSRELSKEEFREEWAEKKTEISEPITAEQTDLSWQLKTLIGRKLLEEHSLEDLPKLRRTDVLDAGDELFS